MPMYRRRESVTAEEVIANIKARPDYRTAGGHQLVSAVDQIELALRNICNKDAIKTTYDPVPAPQILAAMTEAGGWTRETLAGWGITWPPQAGWKRALIDGTEHASRRK